MEEIYKKAKEYGIEIYPYIKSRLDETNPKHITDVSKMSKEDFKKYWSALYNIHNEHAGSYDGWFRAQEDFKSLGATEKITEQGHRSFVSVSF